MTRKHRNPARRIAWFWLLLASPLWAQAADLQEVTSTSLPGDRVDVTLKLSGPAPQPLSFTIDNPARIALDLPGTANHMASKTQAVGVGVVQSVNAVEAKGRTRVVLNLSSLVPYETRIEGNELHIVLGGGSAEAASVVAAAPAPAPTAAPSTVAVGPSITSVDFRRGAQGEGRVLINLSDPGMPVDLREEGGAIVVEFDQASLPQSLAQRLDVTDFATPVKTIDSVEKRGKVKLVINALGDFEHLGYQTGSQYVVEIKPVNKAKQDEEERKAKFGYTGERLSLNFQNIEVRAVLQLIADFTGLNMVVSDSVTGNITLRLKNVPWDQALDIILKTKGLAKREAGNVILVAPSEEIAAREKLELEAMKQVEELAPLKSEFVQINYAKAADIAALLKNEENSLLTKDRGNVSIDERTNTLLVQDTVEKLGEIRKLVETLDIPVRQVLIESRVVIANDDFNRELGVRFGGTYVRQRDGGIFGTTGGAGGTDGIVSDAVGNIQDSGQPFPVGIPPLNDRLNVNLPVLNPAGQIAFALLGSSYLVDLELSALQAEGRGEVVSSPRVITANQKEALIEQGVEIPYQEATSSGATSVSFKKAVLSLQVTPQITPDDHVILDLAVNKDSVGEVFLGVPSINTREVNTQVLVDNGETVVLGGIYEQVKSNEVDRVPFLGELPGVGALFRTTRNVDEKNELLIFVTPKIVKEGMSLNP
jgi:type IV pilus assembly protein PilQ